MKLRELIDQLIDELQCNGDHDVKIEYDTNYDNNVDGIRTILYNKGADKVYYITNNF